MDMAKPNFETFLDLVQRSGLVDKDRLQSAIALAPKDSNGNPTKNVDELAQYLVSIGNLITPLAKRAIAGRAA